MVKFAWFAGKTRAVLELSMETHHARRSWQPVLSLSAVDRREKSSRHKSKHRTQQGSHRLCKGVGIDDQQDSVP